MNVTLTTIATMAGSVLSALCLTLAPLVRTPAQPLAPLGHGAAPRPALTAIGAAPPTMRLTSLRTGLSDAPDSSAASLAKRATPPIT